MRLLASYVHRLVGQNILVCKNIMMMLEDGIDQNELIKTRRRAVEPDEQNHSSTRALKIDLAIILWHLFQ